MVSELEPLMWIHLFSWIIKFSWIKSCVDFKGRDTSKNSQPYTFKCSIYECPLCVNSGPKNLPLLGGGDDQDFHLSPLK